MHLIGSGVRGWSGREGVVAGGGERHGTMARWRWAEERGDGGGGCLTYPFPEPVFTGLLRSLCISSFLTFRI